MSKQENVQRHIRRVIFMGKEITDQIVFDANPGQIITETITYEELICSYAGQIYLRIYQDNPTLTNYSYTFVPIKRAIDHKNIDRNNLPKPYFVINKGEMKVYD